MNLTNMDKIRAIINTQIDKLKEASDKSKIPLNKTEIESLTALAKLAAEGSILEKQVENKLDSLSNEELLLIKKFRETKK